MDSFQQETAKNLLVYLLADIFKRIKKIYYDSKEDLYVVEYANKGEAQAILALTYEEVELIEALDNETENNILSGLVELIKNAQAEAEMEI